MPRSVALDLIDIVLERKKPLDDALEAHPGFPRLEVRDRAFARHLVTTTVRRLGQIDALIDSCLARPLPRKAQGVRHLLRLGMCQLLFLETPPHAAVNTMVALAEKRGYGPHKALVNAVLRRLSREGRALLEAQDAPRLNTPAWLWEAWSKGHGEETCHRIAEAHLNEAPLDLSVKGDRDYWAGRLEARILPTGSLRLTQHGPVTSLPGFASGDWWVQDAAAALPVRLLGNIEGKRVIDLCAAPGGKTAQLAVLGAHVTAVDRSAPRLERLTSNMERLGLKVETVAANAEVWRPTEMADAVLVDAPCSATGTIRRHPDVARLKRPVDVETLSACQKRILAAAVEMVRPGGVLVYCTCSLQPEEGRDVVTDVIASGAPVERIPVSAEDLGGLREVINDGGELQSLPCHLAAEGGLDGFFAARLKRV
jgi:16S rRNA (cytosine967-C5)-methyltransferase